MNLAAFHVSMRVRHPSYGPGTIKAVDEQSVTVQFDDGIRRQVSPESSGLQPAEALAALTGLEVPLAQVIADTVRSVADRLGLEHPDAVRGELASRWHGGKVVLHPADPSLATKEIPIDVFFHKIVMMRNNLRTLEQKLNSTERLSDTEKFDWQGYITRCYGSMTTFNVLFRDKEGHFTSKGGEA